MDFQGLKISIVSTS